MTRKPGEVEFKVGVTPCELRYGAMEFENKVLTGLGFWPASESTNGCLVVEVYGAFHRVMW